MRHLLTPNISAGGRVVRALWGAGLVVAALWFSHAPPWIRIGLLVAAAFAWFEALRGWCVVRACGIKTKI